MIQFFVWLQNFPVFNTCTHTHTHTHTHTQTCYSSLNVENTQRSNVTMRTILCRQFHGIKYCLPVGTQPAHQPRAASKHRGRQPNCAAHCQNPHSTHPGQDSTIFTAPHGQRRAHLCQGRGRWPRVRDRKGETSGKVHSTWSFQLVLQPSTNQAQPCFSF